MNFFLRNVSDKFIINPDNYAFRAVTLTETTLDIDVGLNVVLFN